MRNGCEVFLNLHSLLQTAPFLKGRLFYYEETDSTNLRARCLIEEGVTDAVIVASAQTEGRGRLNRTFFSPPGGLYLSAVLPFPVSHALPTVAAACAVSEALTALCSRTVLCKWVNDLLLDNFKVGGILTEATKGFVIVGIGININTAQSVFLSDFPHVSSLAVRCERPFEPEQAATAILQSLFSKWDCPSLGLIADYKSRLATLGQEVRVLDGSHSFTGTAIDLDDDAALLVVPNGSDKTVRVISGDVSIRGLWGY
jgi:BirA family biotin operon repressor/biotin-[acetyl-CoA-carboxylase] ligase